MFADGPHVFYRQGNSPAQLRHAFYTPGTGWTAHTIDGRRLTEGRGPMVERLQGLYKQLIERDIAERGRP